MPVVSVEPVVVRRPCVLRPGSGQVVRFTPASAAPIRVTAIVGAGNCRVIAELRDASGAELARYVGPLRELLLAATPGTDPGGQAHFVVQLRNDGTVEGDGTLQLEFTGRAVTDEIPLAKLNHLAGVVARNELNPRIVVHPTELELRIDERFDGHVPPRLKHIPRTVSKVVTFRVEELQLGSQLAVEFVPGSARFPTGSVKVTATVAKVRVSAAGATLGGADHGAIVIEVGVGVARERVAVTGIDVTMDWNDAGLLRVIDLRELAARKLDDVLEALARDHVASLQMATRWIKTLMQLDEFLDLRITATGLAVRGIGAPVVPAMSAAPITTPPPGRLKHLVVVMMENRSFDHMLGDLLVSRPHLGTLPQYREVVGGVVHRLRVATTSKVLDDPPHGSAAQRRQAAGGYVQAYLDSHLTHHSAPDEVLTYQPEDHVPFFRFLADHACVCLDWRAAIPGQTWPNRNYALSGTSQGVLDNGAGGFDFYDFPTVCDVLDAHRPGQWRYFKSDVAFLELYRRWFRDDTHIRRAREFHAECAAGTLRQVTWIEPNISDFGSERGSDDHPPADIKYGQGFLSEVYRSLCAYTAKTGDHDWLLVITYDEHGGFYDSRGIGPSVDDDHAAQGTGRRGFRVPAFLVSPWLPPSVCTAELDHASIVRSILDQFCRPGTSLGALKRVRAATSFADCLDFAVDARWPSPRIAPLPPPPFAALGPAFFPPPPPAGQESTIETQIDRGEVVPDGDGATSELWREFMARKREALRGSGAIAVGGGGSELGLDDAPAPAPAPAVVVPPGDVRCEGLALDFPGGVAPDGFDLARDAPGWRVRPLGNHRAARVLVPPRELTIAEAWQRSRDLAARIGEPVDPLWEVFAAPEADVEIDATAGDDPGWPIAQVGAEAAWALPSPSGRTAGEGVVIAHLDTGYTDHPELRGVFATGLGRDLVDGDAAPVDRLQALPGWFPGHGTATASVLASRGDDQGVLLGTAPRATLIEYRISRSVVHLSMRRMTEAIYLAIAAGAHVISISAGGMWSRQLHRAVRAATDAGVVVVAAAGNYWRWTVWPARFDEVIACGACHRDGTRWRWTSGRDPIDLYAPGAGVWVANAGDGAHPVRRGSGTSFAAAITAGAVATWLSFHGREPLLARYGRRGLARAARVALAASAARPADDLPLLDLHALVRAPLPAIDPTAYLGGAESTLVEALPLTALELPPSPSPVTEEQAFFMQLGRLRGVDWLPLARADGSPQLQAALAQGG